MNYCFFGVRGLIGLTFAVLVSLLSLSSPAQAQFKPDVKYALVNDIKLAYYTRGQGEPLMMINGFISSMSLWDPALLEALSKNNTLILFDNRGVGLSSDTKQNNTTIPQMADDAAGLAKALGYKKVNILGWSMGARIGQQLLIRHPELVSKAILCAANPGGIYQIPASKDVEAKLNDPNVPEMDKVTLVFTNNDAGKKAAQEVLGRLKTAVAAGTVPNDFAVSKETTIRQDRARTTLWKSNLDNYKELKNIKVPVLLADGMYDVVDMPKNSQIIANQIPFSWLAYFDGGHAFLFQQYKRFADTVNAFLM
ncbi:alpha/beta hydrolase [Polynucleobacter sp. MWH-UH19D]|uniref:alpha/beta fold hydrolase n=1 Tax=Polynucleobacter sp. MWH-UH19D TaxID=1855610 RepID=UPI003364DF6A